MNEVIVWMPHPRPQPTRVHAGSSVVLLCDALEKRFGNREAVMDRNYIGWLADLEDDGIEGAGELRHAIIQYDKILVTIGREP